MVSDYAVEIMCLNTLFNDEIRNMVTSTTPLKTHPSFRSKNKIQNPIIMVSSIRKPTVDGELIEILKSSMNHMSKTTD